MESIKPNIRQIRVFVSSTFKDMREERDHLVKYIFPQLRRLCESRSVAWGEVDLRWGVTDEQKAEGQVLPICLEEIERCRPFFIGLLGERYGWVPDKIPSYLLEREHWLEQLPQSSVTELEIVHGVLRESAMQGHGFFYFRDPTYLDRLPAGTIRADYESENEIARQKLKTLKTKLRQARAQKVCQLRENYHDPQELGKWVLEDFTSLINTLFPEAQKPGWLEREASEHEVFALSRTGIYIGRQEYFDRLDAHAAGEEPPLVVLGESGSGKSALLANWAVQYRINHPEDLVLMHFLGASPQSTSWTSIIQRIMGEIKDRLHFTEDIPEKAEELRSAFFKWLFRAGAQMAEASQSGTRSGLHKWFGKRTAPTAKPPGRIILILDGLNQLEDRDSAPDLVWLPPMMPANVSLVVSTLAGRTLDEIRQRKWPELHLSPLSLEERRRLIDQVLASHAKSLSPERVDKLARASSCANPLYLRLVLEELCLFGEHELLDERINFYLAAPSPRDLYKKVISRWKQDYGGQFSIVQDTLSLLWAARRGLSETEILEILGTKNSPMPRAEWSPLYLAMSSALVSRAGLLNFAHDYLRSAVFETCLPDASLQQSTHLRLAGYFQQLPPGIRRNEELPWQLCRAKQWQRLADYLGKPGSLLVLSEETHFDSYTFWADIEANSSIRMVDVYRKFIENPNLLEANEVTRFHILLRNTGHLEEALQVFERMSPILVLDPNTQAQHAWNLHLAGKSKEALDRLEKMEMTSRLIHDQKNLAISYGTQAAILRRLGEIDRATELHAKEEKLYRELGFLEGISTSLANQAALFETRDDEKGLALIQEAERIERQRGDLYGLQSSLGIKAELQIQLGELDDALRSLSEQERICRGMGQNDGLAGSLIMQALIFLKQGRLEEAVQLSNNAERLSRAVKQPADLQAVLSLKADILKEKGELDNAMALYQEQERICRSINHPEGLEQSLGGQAEILEKQGKFDDALLLLTQAVKIARQIGSIQLQVWLGLQGKIKLTEGDLDEAMVFFQEQEQLARKTGKTGSLYYSSGYQGLILLRRGQLEQALQQFELAVGYGRQINDLSYLPDWLMNAGLVLRQQKQYAQALEKFLEQEKCCLETNNQAGLCTALLEQGNTYLAMGRAAEALGALQRAESLSRQVSSKPGLSNILAAKGQILKQSGQLDEAEAVLQEHCQLCRQANDANGLQFSLGVRSEIALRRGQLQTALALASEQETISRANQLQKGISAALSTLGDIQAYSGNRSEAKRLYAEANQISRAMNDLESLQNRLGALGWAHFMSGEMDDAVQRFEEQERISRQAGNQHGLQASLGGLGAVARHRGQDGEALRLFEEQEKICRQTGNVRDLQASLNNQGLVHWDTGNFKQAMALFESVEQTCRKLGDQEVLWHTLYNQAEILFRHLGNPGSARKKVSEAIEILRNTGLEPDWLKKCTDLQHEIGV